MLKYTHNLNKTNMSIFNYLKLQPVEQTEDGTVSELDTYDEDEVIDLQEDIDEKTLDAAWKKIIDDLEEDPDKIKFSEEE